MDVKQNPITVGTALGRIISMGYYPKKGEVENSKIKSLASRLKADSLEETLTSILEWQELNIEFWTERHPMWSILLSSLAVLVVVYFLFGSVFAAIIQLFPSLWWLVEIWFLALGAAIGSVVTTLLTVTWIIHFNRKIPVMEGLWNAIRRSISIDFLLENKLGVCRDYAKLTACLLLNIYPDAPTYSATAPGHVATGVMIGERLYMLDQRLPILTIDRWRKYRHPRRFDKVKRWTKNGRPEKIDVDSLLSTTRTTSIDTKEGLTSLAMKMTKFLNAKEQTSDYAISSLEIVWEKGAILYEDDEMVNYSLARYLKLRISSELASVDKITGIEVSLRNYDLIFRVCFGS
jgi:predicted transglutaminase-like protease